MVADGALSVRRIWWLSRCSLFVVPLCVALCLTTMCGVPCSQLVCCVRSSQSGALFSSAGALTANGVRCVWGGGGAACLSLPPVVAVGLSHYCLGGARGTRHFCTCLQICKLTCHWCLLGLCCGGCHVLLLLCVLGC